MKALQSIGVNKGAFLHLERIRIEKSGRKFNPEFFERQFNQNKNRDGFKTIYGAPLGFYPIEEYKAMLDEAGFSYVEYGETECI